MSAGKLFKKHSLSRKFLMLSAFSVFVLLYLTYYIVSSFNRLGDESTDIANSQISSLISSSQTAFNLSQAFSKIDDLSRTFRRQEELVDQKSKEIQGQLERVLKTTTNIKLKNEVHLLAQNFNRFVNGCLNINTILGELDTIRRTITRDLTSMEELISQLLIERTLAGKSTQYIDQLLAMTTGHRESLLRIDKMLLESSERYLNSGDELEIGITEIASELDNLLLSVNTTTASDPEIAAHGKSLSRLIVYYRDAAIRADFAYSELSFRLLDLRDSKAKALLQVRNLQEQSADETSLLTSKINQLNRELSLFVSGGVLVTVLLISILTYTVIRSNIQKPLRQLIRGIQSISQDPRQEIKLHREDEWSTISHAINQMQSELNSNLQRLHQSEERYRLLVENQSDLIIELDRSFNFIFASSTYCDFYGVNENDLAGRPLIYLIHTLDQTFTEDALSELHRPNAECNVEHRALTRFGIRWVSWNFKATQNQDTGFDTIVGVGRDVTDKKNAEFELNRQRHFLRTVIDSVSDPILVVNRDYRVQMCNRAAKHEFGVGIDDEIANLHLQCYQLTHGEDTPCQGDAHPCPLQHILETGQPTNTIHVHQTPRGERHYELNATPYMDEQHQIAGMVQVSRDITDRLKAEEKIRFMAHHDPLTKLPNRMLLHDRFTQAIHQADREGCRVAVMFMDLDHFKDVNDTLGHDIGDQLLIEVVSRIKSHVRETDTISRQGGDEFVILLPRVETMNTADRVATHILSAVTEPVQIEGHMLNISTSIGISLYPSDGNTFEILLKNADSAMYRSKEAGRNTYRYYSGRMNETIGEKQEIQNHLTVALENSEFNLLYQPIIDINEDRVLGMEALLRWDSPEFGTLLPKQFLSMAEENKQIIAIGDWLLKTACRNAYGWQLQSSTPVSVTVNLSPIQLSHYSLVDTVYQALKACGLPAHLLELEIHEASLLRRSNTIKSNLEKLKEIGVHLAVDEFGKGYSSITQLKQTAFDRLKLDQSHIHGIFEDSESSEITHAMIQMANSINLPLVAKGVETTSQLQWLREEGCPQAQGFLLGEPVTAEQVPMILLGAERYHTH